MTPSHTPNASQRLSRLVEATSSAPIAGDGRWSWSASPVRTLGISRLFSRKIRISVGVELTENAVRLAKVRTVGDRPGELLALRSAGLPAEGTPGFDRTRLLRTELRALCGGKEKQEIWAVVPLKTAEINLATVPETVAREGGDTVFYALQEGKPLDGDGAAFDFQTVPPAPRESGEAAPDDSGEETPAMVGVLGLSADRHEVDALRRFFEDAGFPLAGLILYPVAFQNLIRTGAVRTGGKALCRLFVSETFSRIDVFAGTGELGVSRTIRSCVGGMVDVLRARLGSVVASSDEDFAAGKRSVSVDRDAARQAFLAMLDDRFPESGPARGMAPDELLEMVEKPMQRLIWQVERTIEAYAAKLGGDEVATLCVAGRFARSDLIRSHLDRRIELPVAVKSVEEISAPGRLWPSESIVAAGEGGKPVEFATFQPAIGAALSLLERTPNFVFGFRDKRRRARGLRIQRAALAVLVLCAMVAVAGYYWQRIEVRHRTETAASLERQLAERIAIQRGIRLDRSLIELQVDRLREERTAVRDIAKRYRIVALVGGLTAAAPETVHFSRISIALGPPEESAPPSPETVRGTKRTGPEGEFPRIVAEGHVVGDEERTESDLLRYLAILREEPLFARSVLREKTAVDFQGGPALRFVVSLDVEGGTES